MPSDADRGELVDQDALPPEHPPDRPLDADEYDTKPPEERVDEPLGKQVRREEPEDVPPVDDRPVQLLDETEDGVGAGGDIDFGETGDAMLGEIDAAEWAGDDTGPRLGPPSRTPADRVPMSAEEAAVHVVGVEGGAP